MRINMKKKIAEILTLKPKARDNDFYLMYWMWKDEFYTLNKNTNISLDFDKTNIVNILRLLKLGLVGFLSLLIWILYFSGKAIEYIKERITNG